MARHRYLSYRGRRYQRRRRIYLGAGVVIIVVVLLIWFGGEKEDEPGAGQNVVIEKTEGTETETGLWPSGQERQVALDTQEPGESQPAAPAGFWEDLQEPVPGETVQLNPEAEASIERAQEHINGRRIVAARDILNDVLRMPLSPRQRRTVKKTLTALADKWLFSRDVYPGDGLCAQYKVQSGDQLRHIAKQCKVPHKILMRINGIARPEELRAGEAIKIINGPFCVKIYLSAFTMDVYLQQTYVRSFRIGHGREGRETPTGLWCVKRGGKLVKPVWTDPDTKRTYHPEDRDYPLGSRWIALAGLQGRAKGRTGFAIHGTKKPKEIGARNSKGCVRLHNGDVILVYDLLVPVFSKVIVED